MKVQSAAQSDVWPGGKSIAVLVSILFETWSDGKGPSYFPRTTPLKPGTVDHGAIQWAQYGGIRLVADPAYARSPFDPRHDLL
jgi:hypothetical protein